MRASYDTGPGWPSVLGLVASLAAAVFFQGLIDGASGEWSVNIVLITLFVWSIRRPGMASPLLLVLVGVLQGLITGAPMGVWAIAYCVAFAIARDREAEGGGELAALSVRFALLAAIAHGAAWAAGSAALGVPAGVWSLIIDAGLTIVLFPVFGWAFARRRERSAFS